MESSDERNNEQAAKQGDAKGSPMTVPAFNARCAQGFEELLERFNIDDLDSYPNTVYGVWYDLNLAYLNKTWFSFMAENGGVTQEGGQFLGKPLLKSFPDQLKPFYKELFAKALKQDYSASQAPIQHAYECSSPEHYRQFSMALYALKDSGGVLVVNSLVVMQGHKEAAEPIESCYRDGDGIIHQCAHCRKIRRHDNSECWDLVPEWIKTMPPRVSHDLCLPCFEYYYPKN